MRRHLRSLSVQLLAISGRCRLAALSLILLLAACQQQPYHLESHPSPNQDSRIDFLILHYTDEDNAGSLLALTSPERQVSAHYLVPAGSHQQPYPILQLVPDEQRAWHAGVSRWRGTPSLNATSLGIEIVNGGYAEKEAGLPLDQRHWQPFEAAQLAAVGALARDLVTRYHLRPTHVLGHSDVAPERKVDPGPLFPWQRLHDEFGVGAWPDEARVQAWLAAPFPRSAGPWQQALARYGYGVEQTGEWDSMTHQVLRAFQLHFRPARYDGEPDQESWARLNALLERYVPSWHGPLLDTPREETPNEAP